MKSHFHHLRTLGALALTLLTLASVQAQDKVATGPAPAPAPVTTADPLIPVEHLKKLLRAPKEAELAVEAEGWQGLVQAKVAAIAQIEIASLKKKEEVADAEAEAANATSAQADRKVEDQAAAKDQLNESVAKLNEEKAALLERYGIVLDAWEKKGGDVAKMRTYANAVSGIEVEVKDAGATFAALKGWLSSKDGGIKWLYRVVQFLAIMVVAWTVAGILGAIVRKATSMQKEMSDLLRRFLNTIVRRFVLLAGFVVALSSLGINVGGLLALIGGGAFIIGFALQDTLGNFAAGLMLLAYRPFDVGDVVEVGGVTGKVDHVSLVTTKIRTADNQIILVPNKNVWGQTITNVTGSAERRIDLVFGISYEDDMKKAQQILERVTKAHEKVLKDPEPVIRVHALGPSSVDFVCRPWAKTSDYWDVYWDLTSQVKEAFDAEGISIPYPQSQIHIAQLPAFAPAAAS
jgi:small conductance mechanosensitive channel